MHCPYMQWLSVLIDLLVLSFSLLSISLKSSVFYQEKVVLLIFHLACMHIHQLNQLILCHHSTCVCECMYMYVWRERGGGEREID